MEKIGWQHEWDVPRFPATEGERRHRLIREQMGFRGIDCLIVCGNSGNFRGYHLDTRWVSNWASWFDPNYIVFPFSGEPLVFVFSPGHVDLAEGVGFVKARPYKKSSMGADHAGSIMDRIKEIGLERGRIGITPMRFMSAEVYKSLLRGLPHAELIDASDLIRQLRIIKSPVEQECIRKAGRCADMGFEAMLAATRPGAKECELASACEAAMVNNGAELGPHLLIGSGPWQSRSGAIALGGSQRTLKEGDIILNEITACYGGYSVQLCRPISIGTPPDDFMELYGIHVELYRIATEGLEPGNRVEDIETRVKQAALERGNGRFLENSIWALQSSEISDAVSYKAKEGLRPGISYVNHPWTTDASIRPGHKAGPISGHVVGDTFIVNETGAECVGKLPLKVSVVEPK